MYHHVYVAFIVNSPEGAVCPVLAPVHVACTFIVKKKSIRVRIRISMYYVCVYHDLHIT